MLRVFTDPPPRPPPASFRVEVTGKAKGPAQFEFASEENQKGRPSGSFFGCKPGASPLCNFWALPSRQHQVPLARLSSGSWIPPHAAEALLSHSPPPTPSPFPREKVGFPIPTR